MPGADMDAIIAEILSSALQRPVAPGESFTRDSVAAWDSLKHIEIIFATEAALGVRFDEDDIASIASVDDLRAKAALHHAS